jgi:hypothetical protein
MKFHMVFSLIKFKFTPIWLNAWFGGLESLIVISICDNITKTKFDF